MANILSQVDETAPQNSLDTEKKVHVKLKLIWNLESFDPKSLLTKRINNNFPSIANGDRHFRTAFVECLLALQVLCIRTVLYDSAMQAAMPNGNTYVTMRSLKSQKAISSCKNLYPSAGCLN